MLRGSKGRAGTVTNLGFFHVDRNRPNQGFAPHPGNSGPKANDVPRRTLSCNLAIPNRASGW